MKGIVLAGGSGTRLMPLTKITNKHLLPVGREPMIFHPVKKLIAAGIRDILVVTGCEHVGDVVGVLGSGRDFDCEFTYRVQDTAGGIAQALGLARDFTRGDKCVVLLGDNIFEDDIGIYVERFARQGRGARILLKQVPDPQRYGVAEISGDRVVRIYEKPERPVSNYAVTGIYLYDDRVFDTITTLRPSGRGEMEITDVNNAYIERSQLGFDVLSGYWTDAGTHESLRLANELVLGLPLTGPYAADFQAAMLRPAAGSPAHAS
jgi:glucose-1-phosphate thymidylyltransferase